MDFRSEHRLLDGGIGQLDHDGLDLGVELQGVLSQLAASSALLEATEGLSSVEAVVGVHPDGAGLDLVGVLEDSVDVAGEDTGGETVVATVGTLDGLIQGAEAHDAHDGAEDLLAGDGHIVLDIGEDGGLDEVAGLLNGLSSNNAVGSLALSGLDVLPDGLLLLSRNLGAHVHILESVALGALLGGGDELLNELLVDALLDVDAGASGADLALVEEHTNLGSSDGIVDISIIADDEGGLATELEGAAFQVGLGGGLHDDLANVSGASEGDLVDIHVGANGGTSGGAIPGEHVDDTSGVAGLVDELGQAESRQRGLLGGLQNDAAADGEGGGELPDGHEQGEVPGDDLTDNTEGLVLGDREEVAIDRASLAVELVSPAGVVAEALDGESKIDVERLGIGLSVVKGLNGGHLLLVALQEVCELEHEVTTSAAVDVLPVALERLAGGADGDINVGLVSLGDAAELLTGGGVHSGEGLSGLGVHELAINVQLGLEGTGVSVLAAGGALAAVKALAL